MLFDVDFKYDEIIEYCEARTSDNAQVETLLALLRLPQPLYIKIHVIFQFCAFTNIKLHNGTPYIDFVEQHLKKQGPDLYGDSLVCDVARNYNHLHNQVEAFNYATRNKLA